MTVKRFLVVDVSNSFTKWAVATPEKLGAGGNLPTGRVTAAWLKALARRHPGLPLLLSSVVPARTALFEKAFQGRLHRLHGGADLGFPISYKRKDQVGADRLANALGVRRLFGSPGLLRGRDRPGAEPDDRLPPRADRPPP
jgi:type III pantothenate kinase